MTGLAVLGEATEVDAIDPGPAALVVFLLLGFATVVLWLNMRRQLRRIHFDEDDANVDENDAPTQTPVPDAADEDDQPGRG